MTHLISFIVCLIFHILIYQLSKEPLQTKSTEADMRAARNTVDKPPNIVWVMADDLGYNDIGIRNPEVITPNLDRLATEGIIFTNNYVQPICSPSRHSLMTGRYPFASRMQNEVVRAWEAECSGLEFRFLPQYLKERNYHTHMVGKWHLGYCRPECLPTNRGFDTFYGMYDGKSDYWNHGTAHVYDWHRDNVVDFSANGTHSQDLEAEYISDLLDKVDDDHPFFLYFAPQNPHTPSQPKKEFLNLYSENIPDMRRKYLGLVSGLDDMVGKLVNKLTETKLMDNTYLIFASDNGGDVREGLNTPFRGGKGSLFEGGTKSLSFIYSPLLKKSGYENDGLMHITDWMPTLISLAGGVIPEDIDGIDQNAMVTKGERSKRTNMIYNMDREQALGPAFFGEIGARDKRYKLIWGNPGNCDGRDKDIDFLFESEFYTNMLGNRKTREKRGGPYLDWTTKEKGIRARIGNLLRVTDEDFENGKGFMFLFDLHEDPYETTNLAEDPAYADIKQSLVNFIKEQYATKYQAMDPAVDIRHDINSKNPKGYLETGWCTDIFP